MIAGVGVVVDLVLEAARLYVELGTPWSFNGSNVLVVLSLFSRTNMTMFRRQLLHFLSYGYFLVPMLSLRGLPSRNYTNLDHDARCLCYFCCGVWGSERNRGDTFDMVYGAGGGWCW